MKVNVRSPPTLVQNEQKLKWKNKYKKRIKDHGNLKKAIVFFG